MTDPENKSNDANPNLDAISVFRHVSKIARGKRHCSSFAVCLIRVSAVVEVGILKKFGALIKHGLELHVVIYDA
jgi:ATP-dependent DNA helicase HFM1/MER3